MGGWIRRGWILRFWAAPIFRSEVSKPFKIRLFEISGLKIGAPQKREIKNMTPCPSIPWFFCFTKEKPQIYQGFSLTAESTKSLEKTEKIPILSKDIPCLKLTKEIQKTKERKDRADPSHILGPLT